MKKGFIHMVEIILVSLIVIISLPVLLYPFGEVVDWENTILTNNGRDFISISDKIGSSDESFIQNIMEKNQTQIIEKFEEILGNRSKTINYGIVSEGPIKNEIRVGFNCTGTGCNETMKNYLRRILRPAYVNGRTVEFEVIDFSFHEMERYDFDVIFLNDTDQMEMADLYIDQIKNFLSDGGGIIEFVSTGEVNRSWYNGNDQIQSEVFGVRTGGGGGTGNISFKNSNDPTLPNYEIQKYFYGVGSYIDLNFSGHGDLSVWNEDHPIKIDTINCDSIDIDTVLSSPGYERNNLAEDDWFTITSGEVYNFSIDKIDENCSYVMINFEREPNHYKFINITPLEPPVRTIDANENRVLLECSAGRDVSIVNSTSGRAIWIIYGEGDDYNALLRSAVMWAAEKKWWSVLRTVSGEQMKVSYFVSQGEEFHEPYWIEMNMWYIY